MVVHLGRVFIETSVVYLAVFGVLLNIYYHGLQQKIDIHFLGFLTSAALVILVQQLSPLFFSEHTVQHSLHKDNLSCGESAILKVDGLSEHVGGLHLQEIFGVYGNILSIDIPPRNPGYDPKSHSVAYIEFSVMEAATKAKNYLDGGMIDGQTIRVTYVIKEDFRTVRRRPLCDAGLWCSLLFPLIYVMCRQRDIIGHYVTDLDVCFLLLTVSLTIVRYDSSVIIRVIAAILVCWIQSDILQTNANQLIITGAVLLLYFFAVDIIPTFYPGCFTEGELAVLLQIFTFHCHMLLQSLAKHGISGFLVLDTSSKIALLAVSGVVSASLFTTVLDSRQKPHRFYIAYLLAALLVVLPLYIFLFKQDKALIVTYFILTSTRVYLFSFWLVLLLPAISIVILQNTLFSQSSFDLRKAFHFLIIAVYGPGIFLDTDFLYTCSVITLGILVIVETMRYLNAPLFGLYLRKHFQRFVDYQDSGALILTPLYLQIGLSLPLWILKGTVSAHPLLLLSGVLSVGIGDTMAALCGRAIGRIKLPDSSKTLEGVTASWLAQVIFLWMLQYLELIEELPMRPYISLCLPAVLEGVTKQIDNLTLPLFTLMVLLIK